MKRIIEITQVTKSYQNEREAVLKDVSLTVEAGEFVVVMGPSGSGKSSLLYAISGMDQVSSGQILFNGLDITKANDEEMSHLRLVEMGFVFQHAYLLKNKNIYENIMLPGIRLKNRKKEVIIKETNELMKSMGIEGIGDHAVSAVSGGQLQRAAICRALINRPQIIFGDEPTGALNKSASTEVMEILCRLNKQGMTLFLVTHDAAVAAKADRIIFLSDGRIQSEFRQERWQGDSIERMAKLNHWLQNQGF
ncbi:ABC transporter ATP-binding protein [Eubacteriaceae bacterium ES2]|nr:ABC transporter ATP-binding protein [Eubacteriaceae bacterium ES2]